MENSKINLIVKPILIFLILFSTNIYAQAISNDRSLFVEVFATSIFMVDANNDGAYEREDSLLRYAQSHNINTLLLNRLSSLTSNTFSRSTLNTVAIDTAEERHLANFLNKARASGIVHIAAMGAPHRNTSLLYTPTLFFDNVNEFNKRSLTKPGHNSNYCFDMIFTQLDYWGGDPTGNNDNNYNQFYKPGLKHMFDSVKLVSNSTGYNPLLVSTYIGNLNVITGNNETPQTQADTIDLYTDWIYLAFYMRGNLINNVSPVVEFFQRDSTQGRRLERFSNNNNATVIVPLFGSQASNDINNADYFGDYLKNDNGLTFRNSDKYTLQSVKDTFQYYYTSIVNPYRDIAGPNTSRTMKEICETYATLGNSMNNGVGWFKYGTMPDANFYMDLPHDTLGIPVTYYTIRPTQIVDSLFSGATNSCIKCNWIDKSNGITAFVSKARWYRDGVLQTGYNDSTSITPTLQLNDTVIYSYEIEVHAPASTGFFRQLKFRSDIKLSSDPIAIGPYDYWYVDTLVNPSCPSYNNGIVNVGYSGFVSNKNYRWNDPAQQIGNTASNLSNGYYTVKLYSGNTYTGISLGVSVISIEDKPEPTIDIINNQVNCDTHLKTQSFPSCQYEWFRNDTAIASANSQDYYATLDGTYKVKVINSNGCEGFSEDYQLKILPTPNITGSNITCDIDTSYTVLQDQNNASYSWTVPSGASYTQEGNTIKVSWGTASTTGGSIGCAVTNVCGNSAAAYFTVKGCCVSPTTDDLNNETKTLTSTTQTLTGTFNLNGTLSLTGSGILEFDGADISISKSSKILVASGCTLKIDNSSYLHACSSDLWDGIVLEDGARLEINDSRIDDAYTAVYCNKTSSYSIISTIFNNNNIAVLIHGTGVNSLVEGYVRNSIFTARTLTGNPSIDDLKSTNDSINLSHYSTDDRKGYVGIDIENIGNGTTTLYNLKIGDESYSYANGGNLFDNHDYGVRIKNSNVEVVNNKFQKMEGYDKPSVSGGIGVWAFQDGKFPNNYSIKVGGYATNEKNTFTDCGIGTLINEYENAIVVKNLITKTVGLGSYSGTNYNGRLGIKFTNSGISNYDCSTNTISNIYKGIEWVQSEAKHVTCNFNYNNISTSVGTEDCYSAISLLGPQSFDVTTSTIYIENNTISNVWNGIRAENFGNTQDFSIRGNIDILLRKIAGGTAIQYGVFAQRCDDIKITDNSSIRSSSSNNLNLIGIYLSNSYRGKIDCNTIFSIGTAIALNGFSGGRVDGVVHRNILSDYKIGLNIYPNVQVNSVGNNDNSADNKWNNAGGRLDIQCLSTQPLDIYLHSTAIPFKPKAVYGYGGYSYSTASANSNATCNSTGTSVGVSKILTSEDIVLLRMLAEGLIDYTVLAPETKWLYAGIAYNMLMKDSTLSPSDTILGNFLDSLQNTNIGKFYAIDEAINATNWSQAESDNQSISTQNHIEDNLKKYNNYFLAYRIDSTLATDSTWLADMVSDLGPIAAECYSTGGPATPSARMLLSYFTNQIFNEGDDCYKTPLDSIIADSANSVCDRIKQYSVPASANVTYTWTVPSGASFTQSSNTIDVNWGSAISTGGTITCSVMDTLGNNAYASYTEDSLTTAPSCPTVTANNTSCVTATSLSWTASGCAAGYQVTLWTGTGTPNYVLYMQDIGYTSTFALPVLSPTTTYYYQIVPYDYHDSVYSACSTNSFTSGASQAVSPTLTTTITLGAESVTTPALPCGTLVENYDGLGTSYWYTNTTAPRTGSNHMRIDKNPDNTTNLDDWFFSPPINVTAGKAYRVTWYDRIASGTTMEYYSVYFGVSSADASTMTGATPGFNGMANSTTYHKDSATDFLATSTGQIYFGFRATSPHNQGSIYIDDIQVKEMQVTALTSGSCNTTLSSSNTINVTAVTGATNYQYKFVGTGGQSGYNYTHGTFNSATSFDIISKAPGVIYGYTYNVSASFKKNNVWSPFGASCPVTLSAFPQNKLADNPSTPGYCAYTVTDQHDLIGVTTIPGASKYQYKIIENDTTNSYVYDTTSTTFNAVGELRLDMTTISPKVRYDYYYNVQVRGLVGTTNSTYGNRPGEWGTYGQTCVVHVSGKPTTSLTSTYCNTNLTTLNDVFYITPISSASIYRYHITASGYDNTIATSNSNTDFRLTLIPTSGSPGGVKYGTVYTIEAAAYVGGEWLPYGSSCTLTTPTAPTTKLQTSDCNISISSGATSLHWNSIYGASNYQYKVSGDYSNGYRSHEVYRNNALTDFHLSQANQSGSTILANKTYYVQVRYYAGQWEAYGDSCSITTNSNYSRYLDSLLFEESKLSILSMNVFPNPNSYLNEFSVEFDGLKESNQKVDLSIFNTLGKSVYHAKIVTKEETQFVIKPDVKLPPGLYVIMGEVNGERLQRKFVVD